MITDEVAKTPCHMLRITFLPPQYVAMNKTLDIQRVLLMQLITVQRTNRFCSKTNELGRKNVLRPLPSMVLRG